MAAAKKEITPEEARAKVVAFLQRGLHPSTGDGESASCFKHARKLVAKHELFNLFAPPKAPLTDIASAVAAAERIRDVVVGGAATVQAVASDKDVQTLVQGGKAIGSLLGDLFTAGSRVASKVRSPR